MRMGGREGGRGRRVTQAGMGRHGFTLTELLVVLTVLGMLMAIAIPVYQRMRERGLRRAVHTQITNLAFAVEGYKDDCGAYPRSSVDGGSLKEDQHNMNSFVSDLLDSGGNLIGALTGPMGGGAYMEFKDKRLDVREDVTWGDIYVLLDPWGSPYVYTSRNGYTYSVSDAYGPLHPYDVASGNLDLNTYAIYSLGQDKMTNQDLSSTDSNFTDDWDYNEFYNDVNDGHWRGAAKSDARYDDINSWDGMQ